jgi:xylan 1,4-beta-xylosidase
LATRRRDGTLVVAAWNLAPPGTAGSDKNVKLTFLETGASQVTVSRVDPDHGDVHKAYQAMGSPRYPTEAQIRQLRSAAELSAPQVYALKDGSVTIKIPAHGLMLLELKRAQ